jgi:hypothetical protein
MAGNKPIDENVKYFHINGDICMEYEIVSKNLYVDENKIWNVFRDNFNILYPLTITKIVKNVMMKTFQLEVKDVKPSYGQLQHYWVIQSKRLKKTLK